MDFGCHVEQGQGQVGHLLGVRHVHLVALAQFLYGGLWSLGLDGQFSRNSSCRRRFGWCRCQQLGWEDVHAPFPESPQPVAHPSSRESHLRADLLGGEVLVPEQQQACTAHVHGFPFLRNRL